MNLGTRKPRRVLPFPRIPCEKVAGTAGANPEAHRIKKAALRHPQTRQLRKTCRGTREHLVYCSLESGRIVYCENLRVFIQFCENFQPFDPERCALIRQCHAERLGTPEREVRGCLAQHLQ